MMRKTFIVLWIFWTTMLFAPTLVTAQEPAYAKTSAGRMEKIISAKLTISVGKEFLYYAEREPTTKTNSRALAKNQVLRFDASGDWNHFVFGLKGVRPLVTKETTEKWDSFGYPGTYQKNKLRYYLKRIDSYFGYSFYHAPQSLDYTVYSGLRQSRAEFNRTDYILLGNPQPNISTEKVKSLGVLIGLKGEGVIKEQLGDYEYRDKKDKPLIKWRWSWGFEAIIPLKVEVTNTSIPGVTFKEKSGYTIEANVWFDYSLSKLASFEAMTYFGLLHWRGSKWKTIPGGQTKWAKNDTLYLGVDIGLTWRF